MKWALRLVALVALGAFNQAAVAGTNTWTNGGGAFGYTGCSPYTSASAAAACLAGWAQANVSVSMMCLPFTGTVENPGGTFPNFTAEMHARTSCGHNYSWDYAFTDSCPDGEAFNGDMCVEEFDCSTITGAKADRFYTDETIGGAICAGAPGDEEAQCAATPVGVAACAGGECFARLEFTGNGCTVEPLVEESFGEEPGDTNCVSGAGVTVCARESARNCGTVNGQSVCLDSIPPGRCTFLGNGGMVCASSATSPPAPTNEAGDDPAEADAEFVARGEDADEQTYRYYGPGTVAGSGTPTSGSGQGGTSTDDDGEEEEEDVDVGACGADCETEFPEMEEGEDSGTVATTAFGAMMDGALGDFVSELDVDLPTGECPTAEFELYGVSYVVDSHCGLVEDQRDVIGAIFLLAWALFGVRVLMET